MFYIRTDMNAVIATGHMMRCLSIADAAASRGQEVTFILADEQAADLIKQRGYRVIVLHTQWSDMDAELPQLLKVVEQEKIDRLLIDSYQVTESYLKTLTAHIKTLYIDDRNTFVYPVDGIVCYAGYWRKFDYGSRYQETKLFLGLQYTPLRQAFCHCNKRIFQENELELLLLSGGTDPFDMLKSILGELDKGKFKRINVICGRYYKGYNNLQTAYQSYENIHIYQAVSNMEDYMKTADIAVSAGGTTLYELCACGTPAISYSFVDNQLDNVKQFQEDGLIDYAGDVRYDRVIENILRYLEIYSTDITLRRQRSVKMQKLIDGNGASRITDALMNI